MLEDAEGSVDGVVINTYKQGERYSVNETLASCFLSMGCCELVEESGFSEDDKPSGSADDEDAENKKPDSLIN